MKIFEKIAALMFLLLLVGLVLFLTYVPLPLASEKVVLMIIGGLMVSATSALPKLFGDDDTKTRLRKLETEYAILKTNYDAVMKMLVQRHVVNGDGFETPVPPTAVPRIENKSDQD